MKSKIISVCGDIHLNLRTASDYDWEVARYLSLMEVLANDDSGVVVLSGDIFDKAHATLQEIAVFYEGLSLLVDANKEVIIIDGNHEELDSETTTFDLLPRKGFTRIKVSYLTFAGVEVWFVGHPHISSITSDVIMPSTDKKSILISHYRSDIGVAAEEVDNYLVSLKFDDTILSDIHYRLTPADNIRYTSSPYGIHYTPEKDYGYCQIIINDGDYEIVDVNLKLPSKVKIQCTEQELPTVLDSLDAQNKYKLAITGENTTESLQLLKEHGEVTKFSFEGGVDSSQVDDIADELLITMQNSVSDVIVVALADLELTEEELDRAKKILQEEL